MEEVTNAPVEQKDGSAVDQESSEKMEKDSVAYDTYRKVLSEKKKRDEQLRELTEKLSEFQSKEKQRTEEELRKKEDYKKMLELREGELNEYKSKYEGLITQQRSVTKLTSFLDNLDGKVAKKYWDKIDLDQIVYDDETGEVDQMSVKKAIESFKAEYPEIIVKSSGPAVLHTSPKPVTGAVDDRKAFLERIVKSGMFR